MIISIALFFSVSGFANEFKAIDEYAAKVPKSKNLQSLSKKLTSKYTDTTEKYRSIYTWVATHIDYDCKAFHSPKKAVYEAAEVIAKGKSVCSGYSAAFKELCILSGLECETIEGWSKNNYGRIAQDLYAVPDHAWNAIKINGQWQLCDVTWGAGYTEGNCDKYVDKFENFFFCSPPELFALQHYPVDEKWLLGVEISKEEFKNLPHVFIPALEADIKFKSPKDGIIQYKKGKDIKLSFTTQNMNEVIYVSTPGSKQPVATVANKKDGVYDISFSLKKYSPYVFLYFGTIGSIVYKVEK